MHGILPELGPSRGFCQAAIQASALVPHRPAVIPGFGGGSIWPEVPALTKLEK
jgi:hypothetical protein